MVGGYAGDRLFRRDRQLAHRAADARRYRRHPDRRRCFLYWRRFEYRVGANEIRIDSGILNRTHRSIPFDRIQDVDISQGPVARLLGLARVKFETGGSAGAKEDDGALAAIALDRAEALARPGPRPPRRRCRAAADADGRRAAAGLRDGPAPRPARRRVQFLAGGARRPVRRHPDLRRRRRLRPVRAPLLARAARRRHRRSPTSSSPTRSSPRSPGPVVLVLVGLATGIGRTLLREYRFRLDRTRDRASPPPRPADADRRHPADPPRPGRDHRHRPAARAFRLARAQAAKPRQG